MNLRFALRILRRSPGFTAIAIFTLALGIGINTVVFTVYEAVALKPIAARAPRELVRITGNQDGQPLDAFSYEQYSQIREHSHSLAAVVATSSPQVVQGRNETMRVRFVSNNYLGALGVTPRLGRAFNASDTTVAVVSYAFWKNKLAGDPAVLSNPIRVQGIMLDIVGVAPESFAGTGQPPQMPDLWLPMGIQAQVLPGVDWLHDSNAREWQVLGRRAAGITSGQTAAEMEVIAATWPMVNGKPAHLTARPATFFQTDSGEFESFATVTVILQIAVGLILLIGAVNLVNLLLARQAARDREFTVRLALGAGRKHIVRQVCTESVLLGVLGGGAGLAFSFWACGWISTAVTEAMARVSGGALSIYLDLSPDWRIFSFSAVMSVLAGLGIGIWPAIRAGRRDLQSGLKQGSAGSAGETGGRWNRRNLLIGAQVAACFMLLAAAGTLFRGIWSSSGVDTGFETKHLLVVGIDPKALARGADAQAALLAQARDRIRGLPEVAAFGIGDRLPFLGHGSSAFQGKQGIDVPCLFNFVSETYLDAVGVPLVAGRNFTRGEVEAEAPVVVISDVAARRAWPGQDPIGQQVMGFQERENSPHKSFTVIGVVRGMRSTYLSKPDEAYLYFPRERKTFGLMLVRTRTAPETAARSILGALDAVHSNLPSRTYVMNFEQGPLEIQRLMTQAPAVAAASLGLLALLLAAVGIFGLVTQLVSQRTREIAIRVALGASRRNVVDLVLWQTMRPAIGGAVIGLAGACVISALLASMVAAPDMPDLTFGAGAFAPATFLGVVAVLTAAILLAALIPVRRATRIEPAEALRNE